MDIEPLQATDMKLAQVWLQAQYMISYVTSPASAWVRNSGETHSIMGMFCILL